VIAAAYQWFISQLQPGRWLELLLFSSARLANFPQTIETAHRAGPHIC
jgi:hypothetical protein